MVKTAWRFGAEIECLVEVDLEVCLTKTEIAELQQVEFSTASETSITPGEQRIIRDRIFKKIYDHIATKIGQILARTAPSESLRVFREDDSSTHAFITWMLEYDGSIQRDDGAKVSQIPVELYSPILRHEPENPLGWRSSMKVILEAFNQTYDMKVNKSCGMHVHISPISGEWELDSLKKLSYCILWFEEALELLYPDERRQTVQWGKANYAHNPRFQKKTGDDDDHLEVKQVKKDISECANQIAIRTDIVSLVHLMNPPSRSAANQSDEPDRYYAWNFTNLIEGETRTVEYRRPPSKTKSKDCEPWLWLSVAFVDAAVQIDTVQFNDNGGTLRRKYPNRTVEDLKVFLRTSLEREKGRGLNHTKVRQMCRPILHNKGGKMEVQPMKPLTDAELYALEEKKDRKKFDIMKERMVNANKAGVEHVVTPQIEGMVLEDDDAESD
ncbi:MAG: hypothetical protein M1820_006275 [Bogoriella megaspora]|nr:MAG: hypothetical protein M1820_006275 [Bogoriella megaspora]